MKFDKILLFLILVMFYKSLAMDMPPEEGGSGGDKGESRKKVVRGKGKSVKPNEVTHYVGIDRFSEFVQSRTGVNAPDIPYPEAQTPGRHFRLSSGSNPGSSQTFQTHQSSFSGIQQSYARRYLAEQQTKHQQRVEQSAERPERQPAQPAQHYFIENPALQSTNQSRSGNPPVYPVHRYRSRQPVYQNNSGYSMHQDPSGYPMHQDSSPYSVYQHPPGHPIQQDPLQYQADQSPSTFLPQRNRHRRASNQQSSTIPPNWLTLRGPGHQSYDDTNVTYRQQFPHQRQNRAEYQQETQQDQADSPTSESQTQQFYHFLPERRY